MSRGVEYENSDLLLFLQRLYHLASIGPVTHAGRLRSLQHQYFHTHEALSPVANLYRANSYTVHFASFIDLYAEDSDQQPGLAFPPGYSC
jgi:hypothetical protein